MQTSPLVAQNTVAIRRELVAVLTCVLAVVGLRCWQLWNTEVTARDSIGYIRIAWHLQNDDLQQTLRASHQHPLYPAAILGVSEIVLFWLPDNLPLAMQWSSQLVSAAASLVLFVLMYCLGRVLFDRRVALAAAMLFQLLPTTGRVLADGLAEALFLMWATAALLAASVALRRASPWIMAASGLAGGLAYLTRPEGGLVVAAAGLVLLASNFVPAWRMSKGRLVSCGLALGMSALLIAGPYMVVIGGLSVKPTAKSILHAEAGRHLENGEHAMTPLISGASQFAVLAMWAEPGDPGAFQRTIWGFWALIRTLLAGSSFVGWIPAFMGMWIWRKQLFVQPGFWVVLATGLLVSYCVFRVAATMGYLSDRHVLLILLPGFFLAVAGMQAIAGRLAELLARIMPRLSATLWSSGAAWSIGFFVLAVALGLPRTAMPLHGDRIGFRQTGAWLAANVPPGDYVDDPYCWAHYFAGRVFLEGCPELPHHQPPVHYVVYEHSLNKHSRLVVATEDELLARGGQVCLTLPVRRGKDRVEIRVYEVPGLLPPPPTPGATLPPFLRAEGSYTRKS